MYVARVPDRLRHASGANVANETTRIPMTLQFDDGRWSLWSDGGGYSPNPKKVADLTHEQACEITALYGQCIQADVVARNYALWTEAAAQWERENLRKVRQDSEVELLEARKRSRRAKALVSASTHREGS